MGTKRYKLTESEWLRIKDMLPPEHPKEGKRGRPAKCDNRSAMNGILWIARGGATVEGTSREIWPMADCLQPLPQMERDGCV